MDVLRKAYQRAICIPLNNVESIWQEYNQFENGLNKMTVSPLSSCPPATSSLQRAEWCDHSGEQKQCSCLPQSSFPRFSSFSRHFIGAVSAE